MSRPEDPAPTLTVTAFQLAESIRIKACRSAWRERLLAQTSQELFYGPVGSGPATASGPYTYVIHYGVVIYAGRTEAEMAASNAELQAFCVNPLAFPLREEFRIRADAAEMEFGHNEIRVPKVSAEALRIIMLYVGQSVALDYFEDAANALLRGGDAHIEALERHGRLKPSRKTILRYIGQTLAVRNRIIDTLYVLDAPDAAWENEYLDRVDRGMKKAFDVETRFKAIQDQLSVVKENLEVFSNLLQHRESSRLEWIIIILIFIEVVRVFLE